MPMLPNYGRGPGEMDIVGSHQRVLIGSVLRTTGPILELGCGWYSTPLLHEIAETQKRTVLTVDNNEDWLKQFRCLESNWHGFRLVGWWGECNWLNMFGLCFVDQGQPCEREYAIRRLINRVEVFVMHDTEEGHAYGYDRLLGRNRYSLDIPDYGLFKYQWTDHCQKAWTTVASNKVDVTKWFTDLPPVEPTQDVT